MAIKHKAGGAYADIVGVFHKAGGVYSAVQGVFAKSGGAYGAVLATSVSLDVQLSALSGAAPLAVFFDATATTSTNQTEAWRDCIYAFDYGDAGCGNYTYGATLHTKNRNLGGPCGGHVYETPGTYTAKVWCYDGESYSSKSYTITVTDPDAVYSGSNTVCCSTSGNFAGAPAGAATQTVANFQSAMAYATSGKRVLLQRADAWQSTAAYNMTGTVAGARLGSFGTGTKATVTKTGVHAFVNLNSSGISNFTAQDLDLAGASNAAIGFGTASAVTIAGLTLNNVSISAASGIVICSGTGRIDGLTMHKVSVGTVIGGAGNSGVFAQGQRMLILDSQIADASAAEHCIRTPYVGKGLIYGVAAANPGANKHALTVRAPKWDSGATGTVVNDLPWNTYTEYAVVGNCAFGANQSQVCTFVPAGTTYDERIRRCIFENNYVYAQGSNAAQGCVFQAIDCISRNNVYNLSTAGLYPVAVAVSVTTAITPSGNMSIHDTCYVSTSATMTTGFNAGAGVLASTVKNLCVYAPLSTNVYVVNGAGITAEGNPSNAQGKTQDPLLVGPLTSYAGFALGTSSPRKNAGVAVPVWSDGLWYSRDTSPDGGAMNSTDNRTSFWSAVLGQP